MDLAKNKEQILSLSRKDRKKILNSWIKLHNDYSDKKAKMAMKGEIKWLKKSLREK